jgi:branched-chain amino acid aminotransferase
MHARRPDPNAKIANLPLRKNADALIRAENVFEVLLIDNNDFVTEGSRSNIFFVTDEHIMTPELQQVLPGITRQAVMDICRNNNIVVREGKIKYDDIDRYMGAFITGTSPGVLPVKKIDKVTFDAQIPVVRLIMKKYDERVNDYFNGLKYICDENR